jgi:hypothetical protein
MARHGEARKTVERHSAGGTSRNRRWVWRALAAVVATTAATAPGPVSPVSSAVAAAPDLVPAGAAGSFSVTAPADVGGNDAVWYTGETRDITWTVDTQTGAYTLELWSTGLSAAKLATIATGADMAVGAFAWTIPVTMPTLVAEDVAVRVVPAVGDPAESEAFDLRRSTITSVNMCDEPPSWPLWWTFCLDQWSPLYSSYAGLRDFVYWNSAGITGPTVKIELLRTVGDTTTSVVLAKAVPNDGEQVVTMPAKATPDTGFDESYRVVVTPTSPNASSGTSRSFPIRASETRVNVNMGDADVTVAEGEGVQLDWYSPWRPGMSDEFRVEARPATGKPIRIYTGRQPGPSFEWRPPAPGTYAIVVTNVKNRKVTDTADGKVVATANDDVVRQAAPSDTTPVVGQPITLSWAYFDGPSDTDANDVHIPVDIDVVDSTGKVTSVVKNYSGVWITEEMAPEPEFVEGEYEWRPSASSPPACTR